MALPERGVTTAAKTTSSPIPARAGVSAPRSTHGAWWRRLRPSAGAESTPLLVPHSMSIGNQPPKAALALMRGRVHCIASGVATIELPGGVRIQARGIGSVGTLVFVRDDLIEGPAPNLQLELIEV